MVEWGENAAKSFVKNIYSFLDILVELPEIGTLENKEKGIRGFTSSFTMTKVSKPQ